MTKCCWEISGWVPNHCPACHQFSSREFTENLYQRPRHQSEEYNDIQYFRRLSGNLVFTRLNRKNNLSFLSWIVAAAYIAFFGSFSFSINFPMPSAMRPMTYFPV